MTGKELIEVKIAEWLKENPAKAQDVGAAVIVELSGDTGGRWLIDTSKQPATIDNANDSTADTTIIMETAVLEKIINGELDAQMAFMSGQVKVEGSLGIAIKFGQLLV